MWHTFEPVSIFSKAMNQRLFVYGTLGPGRPNAHVLEDLGGQWHNASVRGRLREAGWGAEMGYPGIDLDPEGDEVQGFIFESGNLADHWDMLDEFEGEGYRRVTVTAYLEDGTRVDAQIYQLKSE